MSVPKGRRRVIAGAASVALMTIGLIGIAKSQQTGKSDGPPPDLLPSIFQHAVGDRVAGQETFRFETFGNQGFWTDAMQLPQGIAAAKVTPLQALQLGLNVNVEALNPATVQALSTALQQVQAGMDPSRTAIGDPNVTLSLINQNAVIGVVAFDPQGNRKPTGNTGTLNLAVGDKVGVTCALCHAITDNSVLAPTAAFKTTGSVGKEVDGPTPHGLDVGAILAVAQRTLAYYPMLQLQFKALKNATIGRGSFPGLLTTPTSLPTEAQADAYLTGTGADGKRFYPVGQFDAFPDGIGNPLHIAPFFRTDLAAPWGIDGAIAKLEDFNNTVYTVSLDPTSMLTPGGRAFLHIQAGPVGDEIANDYEQVLKGIGVIPPGKNTLDVVPFVQAQDFLAPSTPNATTGRRVENKKLLDLNAYLNSLPSPGPGPNDAAMAARGREVFRTSTSAGGGGCTACHQLDPNKFVPPNVIPMSTIYPAYNPTVLFVRPMLDAVQKSFGGPSPFFDDRMVVLDASRRGEVRGVALPLLLDLVRKTTLLHDDSVAGATFDEAADNLLNSAKRDPKAAHPFFISDAGDRKAVIEFLKSLAAGAPIFSGSSVANFASFMGGTVAPGEVIAISGLGLGIAMANASMSNTTATFDGIPATLISVSSTQVTVIAPYQLAGKSSTQLVVSVNGQSSAALTIPVAATAPGIFTISGTGTGQGAVLNQDGTINSSSNPAAKGSVISIYGTGEGQTSPAGVNGQIISSPPPKPVAAVTAMIDNQNAQVTYAGGGAGLIAGVLQVNAIVPVSASAGNVPVTLTIGENTSQTGVTIWVK